MVFAFVYDETRLIAMFFKVIAASISLVIAFRIRKKNPTYILNKLLMVAFICWGGYLMGDSLNFIIAPQNSLAYTIANAMYDIQYLFLFIFVYLILAVAKIIRFGSQILKKKIGFIAEAVILLGCLVIFDLLTAISVIDTTNSTIIDPSNLPPSEDFIIMEGLTWNALYATILPFTFYGVAVVLLFTVIIKTMNRAARKKLILMNIGMMLFAFGVIYFIILRIIFNDYHIWTMILGQMMFIAAPILVNMSLHRKTS